MPRRPAIAAPPYKVGELASLAGVSVRTLHHYEAVGLLTPSARTNAGHRLYGADDVARLARITALTALGLSLAEVRRLLDDPASSPLRLVERHLARAHERLDEHRALCARLERLRDQLRDGRDDVETFLETAEVMTMIDDYYTDEQKAQLARRRAELGDEQIRAVEREWQDLFAHVRAEMERGTPPDAAPVRAIARRWQELIGMFTGGDPGIAASLQKMYAEQPVQQIHPSFDPAIFAYMKDAMAALGDDDR
ncbi:MAG: MerR family transcriptional regulator [Kofleriaceae bacterium]|nr:MerR family transcriptional regulator [Kofleriaceae bacterium]